jgi:hypothetical protein
MTRLPEVEKIAKPPLPPVILILPVILSEAKNPAHGAKTLRSAQGDKMEFCNFPGIVPGNRPWMTR